MQQQKVCPLGLEYAEDEAPLLDGTTAHNSNDDVDRTGKFLLKSRVDSDSYQRAETMTWVRIQRIAEKVWVENPRTPRCPFWHGRKMFELGCSWSNSLARPG